MNQFVIAMALIPTLAALGATAATSDADMTRCAAIRARDPRLDCYDALAQQLSIKAAAPTATQVPPPPPATAPAVSTTAAAVPATVVVGDQKNFGLSAAQQHTVDAGPKVITANISNLGSDQKGATLIVLDNGQTWSVTDNDGWLATGQAIRIKRATMGSYLMLIPSNHSYHVRRIN